MNAPANEYGVIIVGGGPAGMMAAAEAAKSGAKALLIEKNEKTGKKLYISGKGRCNLTNAAGSAEFLSNVVNNPRFLMSALNRFTPSDTAEFFKALGVPLKTERGGRVFPASDKSSDIIKAFNGCLKERGVGVLLNTRVISAGVSKEHGFTVKTDGGDFRCRALIIACGGASYPACGSTGDGYTLAAAFGHKIIPPVPALSAILCKGAFYPELAGLSLKNVKLTAYVSGKMVFSDMGELLFTHTGVSGPLALSASSYINRAGIKAVTLTIDLKPALTADILDARVLRDFSERKNKAAVNALDALLPKSLAAPLLAISGVPEAKPVNSVTRAERAALVKALKAFPLEYAGLEPLEKAIVTAGGVDVAEINPRTMESKLVKNLYFCGEVLNADALTGGFNIQIALSTGCAAGASSVILNTE